MKYANGIISSLIGIAATYQIFFNASTDVEFGIGFGLLLMAIIFLLFMILDEQKEEIERLRQIIRNK
jgi:hypothetical protein